MEDHINNKTYNAIISALECTNSLWQRVNKDLTKVSLRKLPIKPKESTSSYLLFYDGVFTGFFIKEQYIDLNELKQIGWNFEGEYNLFA